MEERFYTRIKRGMVFWYDIDPSVDKLNVPDIRLSSGKTVKDYLEYGERPWLLVSVDERNILGKTCTIVPIHTNVITEKGAARFHVPIKYKGKDAIILCNHITTVNCVELIKYDCMLEDNVMRKVEASMKDYLGIREESLESLVSGDVLKKLEGVIGEIVRKKVEEERERAAKESVDVDDAVLRIGEGLESLFGIAHKEETPVEEEVPFEKPVPVEEVHTEEETTEGECVPERPIRRTVRDTRGTKIARGGRGRTPEKRAGVRDDKRQQRTLWDKPSAIEFIQEVEILGLSRVADKRGYANDKTVRDMVRYLKDKFDL